MAKSHTVLYTVSLKKDGETYSEKYKSVFAAASDWNEAVKKATSEFPEWIVTGVSLDDDAVVLN